ncbi:2-hydroxy-6-oxonona-2,4-dienedioate hydrolase [Georgenia soli]|uniref:2-hydroxy-6-oxonona-2,4-dienedioate hydrolase n=1 Tax=Georgenia soli TaxID=638953 RepID=A0A2A9ELY9_9MICO|nr:alpha/beta hydrolase [Georgenia soli]PFG39823.1 2-hydroxy-6-oxonona-2,4-dienedioate hydrolase [Georgenia soli]
MNGAKGYRSVWTYLNTVPHKLAWVDVDGVRTRYLEAGPTDAPVVVCIHGTAGSLENFAANYAALASKYRVLGIDMVGCGYTDKPDYPYLAKDYAKHVAGFMDAMGIESAALAGVSLGSWVSGRVALDFPDRVDAMVMFAPAGVTGDEQAEKEFFAGVRQRRMAAAAEPNWDTVTTAMRGLVLNKEDLVDDIIAVRLNIYRQPELQAAMPNLLAYIDDPNISDEEWRSIDVPALVVASVDAPNMFLANSYRLAELMPRATLWEIRNCDHWPQFESPDEVNAEMIRFLDDALLRVPAES